MKLPTLTDYTACPNSNHKKILLVTLFDNNNYGNILQRCALSRVIESLGFEVWHLCGIFQQAISKRIIEAVKNIIKHILAFIGVEKYRELFSYLATRNNIVIPVMNAFVEKYITRRIDTTYDKVLAADSSVWSAYDYAVAGSDQVWHNWSYTPEELEYYYLSFIPREKRVCYAPSFGFSSFSDDDYQLHRQGLSSFDRLSCREQEMQPLIMQASGKEARVVLDPTLLLTDENWRAYAEKPDYDVPDKYVLCYFLGQKTPDYMKAISRTAGGLPVINVMDYDDKAHLDTAPSGFLWLIDHADFICTDSFHGTVFSILFGKNFLTFKRRQMDMEDMFGRIDGLLANLNITGHVYEEGMTARPDAVNYDDVYSRLEALRKSSMDYLRECLVV